MKKRFLIKILKEILNVENLEIKDCALESLIERLEEEKDALHEKNKLYRNK